MTRAVRGRILKDGNCDMSDHLHNHIHLTNCIHLKNHMHKNSPMLVDRTLLRDLIYLQRSRSLRDPSTSLPLWHSPTAIDMLLNRGERDVLVNGRRSVGLEHRKECRRMSGSSPPVTDPPVSKAAMDQLRRHGAAKAASDCNRKNGLHGCRTVRREKSGRAFLGNDAKIWKNDHPLDVNDWARDIVSRPFGLRDKSVKKKGGYRGDRPLKTLSDQLKDIIAESGHVALSYNHDQRHAQVDKIAEEAEANTCNHGNNMKREKRHKFRSTRRNRLSISTQDAETQQEMSVASNSFAQGRDLYKYHVEEEVQEYDDQSVAGVSRNGCGVHWNWSRIHRRGKSFLDMAGRSLSCGLSESQLKRDGNTSPGRGISNMPLLSEQSSSSIVSDTEALSLLLDASGSQGSIDHAARMHDYSGELGIFADNLLKQEIDSDLASEGGSHEQHRFRRWQTDRHQNLTQKYIPRTFRDLVGQNLIVQALSNAIMKKKVGLLYVFYGPRGTGKTTCARIFARALNCQSLESTKPCGFCDSCIAHDMGKNQSIREIDTVCNIDYRSITELFDNMTASQHQYQYGVLIFDECDTLSSDCWNAVLKVIDGAPRHVVFILVCSSLDVLPHIIISRCQKFFFTKLKDADIIYTLQGIATKEDLVIDKDALKLIASRSDGSLRDAEMTLEQLSLIGQRVSVRLVQELVGLISDENLVELLDSALSADTTNTVKNLRYIMESGVEPLALTSQLAAVITDILAGSYDTLKERTRMKFFQHQALSKEDMEKLRQALKTLCEADKQLRVSNDKMTWLTAALLQLAPDQRFMIPGSPADTRADQSPLVLKNTALRVRPRKSNAETLTSQAGSSREVYLNDKSEKIGLEGKGYVGSGVASQQVDGAAIDKNQMNKVKLPGKFHWEIEEIWLEVLEKIQIASLKEFMYQEGKLISLSYGAAPTVQLLFNTQLTKSDVEKFRSHILQAFESVLKSPVTIEIGHGSRKDTGAGSILLPELEPSDSDVNPVSLTSNAMLTANHNGIGRLQNRDTSSGGVNRSEIVEVDDSPSEYKCKNGKADSYGQNTDSEFTRVTSRQKTSGTTPFSDQRKLTDRNQSLSLVRSKVSLANVIQHAERCSHCNGWSKRKADSIAEKLEQENLRLEPRSRRLLCWKPPRLTRPKLSRLKIRTRKSQTVLKFVSCGRCLSDKSSR